MYNKFCPFINGTCRENCTFYLQALSAIHNDATRCLIASRLDHIFGILYEEATKKENDTDGKI